MVVGWPLPGPAQGRAGISSFGYVTDLRLPRQVRRRLGTWARYRLTVGSLATQKRQGWPPPSPATPVRGPFRSWSGGTGVPDSRRKGPPSGAQASAPLRERSTPRAVASRAGSLASSLSFRAERRRSRARQAVRAIICARLSSTPRGEESRGGNLTQQVELSQALCDRNGWSVVAVP